MTWRAALLGSLLAVSTAAAAIVPAPPTPTVAQAQPPGEPPAAEPAKEPPRLTLYTSFDPQRLTPLLTEFQKSSGIQVQVEMDQADLLLGLYVPLFGGLFKPINGLLRILWHPLA